MLSGQKIRRAIALSQVEFTGQVRGNALLLTLGSDLQAFRENENLVVEPWSEYSVSEGYDTPMRHWQTYDLLPSRAVLVAAREYLRLPAGLAGIIGTLSHVARLGLFAHLASPLVAPCFSGYICLELFNVSGHILRITPGLPIAKVVLVRSVGTDPEHGPDSIPSPYNSSRGVGSDLRSRLFEEFGRE